MDKLILPLLFALFTVAQILKTANVLWAGIYVLMGLYLLTKVRFLLLKLREPRVLRACIPYFVLIVTQIPLCVSAWLKGIDPVTAPVLLVGYVLLGLTAACVRFQTPDVFREALRLLSFLVFISALFGLFEAILIYCFPGSRVLQIVRIICPYGVKYDRVISFFRNPLPASTVFIIGFWLPFFFRNRYLRWLEKAVLVAVLLMTKQRSGWAGFVLSVIVYLIVERKTAAEAWRSLSRKEKAVIFALCAVALIFLIYSGLLEMIWKRLYFTKDSQPYMVRVSNIRVFLTELFRGNTPLQSLIGHGFWTSWYFMENSGEAYGHYTFADNSYMTVLYDFGLVFICFFLMLVLRMCKVLFVRTDGAAKETGNEVEDTMLPADRACARVCLSCLAPAFFYDYSYWPVPLILIIFCSAPFFMPVNPKILTPIYGYDRMVAFEGGETDAKRGNKCTIYGNGTGN